MTRQLTIEAEPLDEDHILGLRESFAKGTHGPIHIEYDHGFGFGRTFLAITARWPDGRIKSETIDLSQMLQDWGLGVINDHQVGIPTEEEEPEPVRPCKECGRETYDNPDPFSGDGVGFTFRDGTVMCQSCTHNAYRSGWDGEED